MKRISWILLLVSGYVHGQEKYPDFSYAGYHHGEAGVPDRQLPLFDVTLYGAVPDDDHSDRAAIELALRDAGLKGGGIVFFPPGRFLVNEDGDKPASIVCTAGNIVFRGSPDTELFMKNPLPPRNPAQMWSTPPMFYFTSNTRDKALGVVTGDAAEGSFTIRLDHPAGIKAGDWIMLYMRDNDPALISAEMGGHPVDTAWTNLVKKGVEVKVVHQVKAVKGRDITLVSPLTYPVNSRYRWQVFAFGHNSEVGVENITFSGNWTRPFVHHRSVLDDSGWNMLNFSRLTNAWIRNCRFNNVNIGATISVGANISVLNCVITGNGGHEALCNNGATNVLLAKITDSASMFHSVGVNGHSMNTVIWKCAYPSTTSFESHSSQPRNTLLDCVEGGRLYNRGGGAVENMPNHMRNLVFWNYRQTNAAYTPFNFWPEGIRYWRIPAPVVVGFHGATTTFIPGQLKYEESTGKPVTPQSLYEAQLAKRLHSLPAWLGEL